MDATTAKLLYEKISSYNDIIIAKHKAPDWDAVGSAKGLEDIIKTNFPNKNVYVVGRMINTGELMDDTAISSLNLSNMLLITVDTANIERVDFERHQEVKETFRIDHHINDSPHTTYEHIEPDAIACTQVITLWADYMGLKISKLAGEYLYRGLLTDSNRFAYQNTSEDTFKAAQILLRTGIDLPKITREIYSRTWRQAKWNAEAFSRVVFDPEYRFAYMKADWTDMEKYQITNEELKSSLGVMGGIEEIDVWAMIYKIGPEERIKISLRSKEIDINKLAVRYGGGGHRLASGGYLNDWSEVDEFLVTIKKYIKGEIK